ncbi:restriction endonuclease subunit S [Alienimonas californiensis]|uniref:EcoKI restriction-modification system protein HsdS n=1 Tax=Alienimonas californiensis TaxID=2527989 RepID=A0A517P6T0_9PLAN|nr:restriction endonuclease subunit S [Alienimonas californiensis]QDT15071.1 EcoKI restriction-modification system protein HsdS [Alienimonas californiensis]
MSLSRYESYKDSGVEWLGEVPAGWEVIPPKRIVSSKAGGTLIKGQCSPEPADDLVPAFSASGQDVWVEEADYSGEGIVLSAVGALCGKTFKADREWGVVANTHCLFCGPDADRDFFWYVTNVRNWWVIGGTAQPFVKVRETLERPWVFPPRDEQTAIAAYLDRETGKIDGLVAEQRRLIGLLAEKRRAAISRVVTRGLDPAAPRKPTGVNWLGDVPEHWQVLKLSRVATEFCDGPFGSGLKSSHYVEEGVRVIRLGNIRDGEFERESEAFIDPDYYREGLGGGHDVRGGDLVVAGLGDANHLLGRACVAPADLGPTMVKADCFRFRLDESSSDAKFVSLCLNVSASYDAGLYGTGTTRTRMNLSTVANRRIVLPPLSEQKAIADRCATIATTFGQMARDAESAVALLLERRSALISAAVTGQIDVRGLA